MQDKDLCPASVTNSKFFLITCDKNLTQSNGDSKNREIPMFGDFGVRMSPLMVDLSGERCCFCL